MALPKHIRAEEELPFVRSTPVDSHFGQNDELPEATLTSQLAFSKADIAVPFFND